MAIKKKVSKIKVKKKIWCRLIAPKMFGGRQLGEMYLTNPEKALGRKLRINLKDLTGNVRDQNMYVMFQVNNVQNTVLHTAVLGYELNSAFVKRLVRKNTARLDNTFNFTTKGGKRVILKSLMITQYKAQRSVKTALHKKLQELLQEEVAKVDFQTFINSLVTNRLRGLLKRKLSKIYPLKEVTVRVVKLQEKGLIKEEVTVDDKTKEEK